MSSPKPANLECRLLDELTDDAAARLPESARSKSAGKTDASARLVAELCDDRQGPARSATGPCAIEQSHEDGPEANCGPVELAPGEFVDFIPQGANAALKATFLEVLKHAWQKVPGPARRTILDYYDRRNHWYPRVILGNRVGPTSPIATGGGENDGFMAWFDSLALSQLPGKEPWTMVVIGEELAHAFLLASQDPTHLAAPPNEHTDSQEYRAWNNAREEAARKVLYQWPFDQDHHRHLVAWLQSKAR